MRVQTRLLTAEDAAVLTRDDPAPFIAVAGDRFLSWDGSAARVRDGNRELLAYPGWMAIRLHTGRTVFVSEGLYGDDDDLPWTSPRPECQRTRLRWRRGDFPCPA